MGKIASLVPQDMSSQQTTLANHVNVLTQIRAYAIAVEQTNLATITNPPPDWFKTLNANLQVAKTHAAVWTTTLEPAITSTVPQAAINLGSRFQTGTDAMLAILKDSKNNPTADQIAQMKSDLQWITRHLNDEEKQISDLQGQFTTFQTNADTDLTNLTTGNNSIQQAILDDNKIIANLNADIAIQNAEIAKDNAAITASAIAGGVGLFVGIGVIGFGAAATGPAAPIAIAIGAFIMVGSIVEMAAVIAVYETRLAKAQSQLNQDTTDLANEQQQVASLTVMNKSITNLVDLNKAMSQSLADIATWWSVIDKQLKTVISDISDASSDMSASDWSDLSMDIAQAQKDWANFVNFATQMQTTITTIQNQVVNLHNVTPTTPAAATTAA